MLGFLLLYVPLLVIIFLVISSLFNDKTATACVIFFVVIHFVAFFATVSGIIFSAAYIMDEDYWKGPVTYLPHNWPIFTFWVRDNSDTLLGLIGGIPTAFIFDFWHAVFYIWWNKFSWGFAVVAGAILYFTWVNFIYPWILKTGEDNKA